MAVNTVGVYMREQVEWVHSERTEQGIGKLTDTSNELSDRTLIFLTEILGWRQGQIFPIYAPAVYTASSTVSTPHQGGTFITIYKPMLTLHSYPKL